MKHFCVAKKIARFFEIIKTYHTANEGPVRIRYKCLVPIYAFPEMKILFPEQNYNILSPVPIVSVRDLYISRIGLPILLQENMWNDPVEYMNRSQTHEYENWIWD
jgi:hypothetical protein